jgi:dinuclear metal center YbgI/SA1388 family protein
LLFIFMIIRDIVSELERFAPLSLQEDYDNSGMLTGSADWETNAALLTLDCTEEVVDEAIRHGINLIIAHHPIIFSGLKKITGSNYIERTILKAIKNDICIYACHTNIDNVLTGVNNKIASKFGLINCRILDPKNNTLKKLVTFVPQSHKEQVLNALFEAGAGAIGNYDSCSFSLEGTGTFKGNEESKPFLGTPGKLSKEQEHRIETVFENWKERSVLDALIKAHPYEEVAFDIYKLENRLPAVGSGIIGELKKPVSAGEFLTMAKDIFQVPMLKHTKLSKEAVQKVAICGGSGRFLLKNAIRARADAFITADFKYHEFFDAVGEILLVDPGHYETEQFTPELFSEIIRKKFSTFAVRLSEIKTNPVNYF